MSPQPSKNFLMQAIEITQLDFSEIVSPKRFGLETLFDRSLGVSDGWIGYS